MQQRDDEEGDRGRQPEPGDARPLTEQRLEQLLEDRLADDAEPDAGERDAELAGRQVGVDVLDRVPCRARARAARALHLDGLGQPQPGDREL